MKDVHRLWHSRYPTGTYRPTICSMRFRDVFTRLPSTNTRIFDTVSNNNRVTPYSQELIHFISEAILSMKFHPEVTQRCLMIMLLQGHGLLLNGLAAVAVLAVVLLLRLLCVMPWRRRGGQGGASLKGGKSSASTLVVMGSGGHTTEMLGLVKVRNTTGAHINRELHVPVPVLAAS